VKPTSVIKHKTAVVQLANNELKLILGWNHSTLEVLEKGINVHFQVKSNTDKIPA
jgi:hypothetical protein